MATDATTFDPSKTGWSVQARAIGARVCVLNGLAAVMALGLALTAAGCTSGKPGTTHRNYFVHGADAQAFARSVRSNAPRAGRAFGLVEITFHPDFTLVPKDRGCHARVRDVGLELVITLPKWRSGKSVPTGVKRRWTRFRQTITRHEDTHVRIARSYAKRMARAIAATRSNKDCRDLSRKIKTRIAKIKVDHLKAHARFDRRERKRLKTLL